MSHALREEFDRNTGEVRYSCSCYRAMRTRLAHMEHVANKRLALSESTSNFSKLAQSARSVGYDVERLTVALRNLSASNAVRRGEWTFTVTTSQADWTVA